MVNPEHYNTLFSLAQDLIRIPSPPGQERDVAEYLQRTMGEMGFTEVQSDKYGNVIGRISFSKTGRSFFSRDIWTTFVCRTRNIGFTIPMGERCSEGAFGEGELPTIKEPSLQ